MEATRSLNRETTGEGPGLRESNLGIIIMVVKKADKRRMEEIGEEYMGWSCVKNGI